MPLRTLVRALGRARILHGALPLLLAAPAAAQAREIVVPERDYLLRITRDWARESPLEDLVERRMDEDDVELRVWGGYGLAGTSGVVMRRTGGRWSGWEAIVRLCAVEVPVPVGDTLSAEGRRRYQALARERCEAPRPGAYVSRTVIMDHKVELRPLAERLPYARTWNAAVREGVLTLPPRIPRTWSMLDGHHYVVEVRRGGAYRGSVIEHTRPPETEDDRRMQRIAARLWRVLLGR